MTGLLKNDIFGVASNLKVYALLVAVFGVGCMVSGSVTVLNLFCILTPSLLSAISISSLRLESDSRWPKYKLTLPVRRKDIVKGHYLNHLLWSMVGMMVVMVTMALTVLVHGNQFFYYGWRDAITLIVMGVIIAVFIGALVYPMYYYFGAMKAELILLGGTLGAVAIVRGLSLLINTLLGEEQISTITYVNSVGIILVVAFIGYALSYFVTCRIFAVKEY